MRGRLFAAAAVLAALALGLAIGAGPLQDDRDRADDQSGAIADRDRTIAGLVASEKLATAYTGTTAARAVAGLLPDRKVTVVTLPGTDPGTVRLLEGLVHAAGARVTARVALTEQLLDGGKRGLVDALSSQMAAQTPGFTAPAGASGYERFGALLGRGVAVPPSAHVASASYDTVAISVLSGFEAAGLADGVDVAARAGLTFVVLPPELASTEALTGVLAGFTAQIPTVLVGPAAAAADGQVLASLRAADQVRASTVDSVDSSVGRVIAVLALAARTRGVSGDFGVVGLAEPAVPDFS